MIQKPQKNLFMSETVTACTKQFLFNNSFLIKTGKICFIIKSLSLYMPHPEIIFCVFYMHGHMCGMKQRLYADN